MAACKICKNDKIDDFYSIKEMMFGTNETFTYFLCSQCNCMQIETVPSSIDKYYENNYYSFKIDNSIKKKLFTKMAVWRDKAEIYNSSLIGAIISKFVPAREEVKFISYLENINKDSKILDVGSGMGFHLKRLAALGFTNLRGIDPFLKQESCTYGNVVLIKKDLNNYQDKDFNLITLHHTFEHLPNPAATLELVSQKLTTGGYCVIRTPVMPNEAWNLYRENWFQIDAPRHFFIHSVDSINILRKAVGLSLEGIIYDSTAKQFYNSELYQKGISLNKKKGMSKKKHAVLSRRAAIANKLSRGDQAIFILKKI